MKIKDIRTILNYTKFMGIEWILFRLKYFIRIKSNYFVKKDLKTINKDLKISKIKNLLKIYDCIDNSKTKHIDIANKAIEGNIYVFSNEFLNYGNPKKWHYNPMTQKSVSNKIHWSKIPDFGEIGDIKIPWEIARFPHFFSYIKAHRQTNNEQYLKAFKDDMQSWLESNKFPNGIHYKCGQEMTFRLYSILVSVNYFYDYLEDNFLLEVNKHLSFYGYRIEENIDYATKSVKNDHAISEPIGLIILGLLFMNDLKDSQRWLSNGRNILIKEIKKQIYTDGSYICHSLNYQREVLDELSFLLYFMLSVESDDTELIKLLKQSIYKMIVFLNSFIQKNGWLPNYGSNDGANLFPVYECNYRDYRTSLNFAMAVTSGELLFKENLELIELFSMKTTSVTMLPKYQRFDKGGYYILKNEDIFSFIRCHSYHDRPAQNDMLHLDVWYKGENIFCDAGSYSYNTDKQFKNNFNGTIGHNTIMINDENQMEQVLNFGWSNWTQSKLLAFDDNHFVGEHYGYKKKFGVTCRREVLMDNNKLLITDYILNVKDEINIKQIWNTKEKVEKIDNFSIKIQNCILTSNQPIKLEKAYISDYYNSYVTGIKIIVEAICYEDNNIKTTLEFIS